MTVRELIAVLQACDPNIPVVIGYEGTQSRTVAHVEDDWHGYSYKRNVPDAGLRFTLSEHDADLPDVPVPDPDEDETYVLYPQVIVLRVKDW